MLGLVLSVVLSLVNVDAHAASCARAQRAEKSTGIMTLDRCTEVKEPVSGKARAQ